MAPKPTPIRVLVVDDHTVVAEALRTSVEREGFEVRAATSGEDALRAIAEDPPDIVLMDVNMPGIDGVETARRIRGEAPGTRVVMLSAFEDDLVKARALDAGAVGFLSKAGPMADLVGALRRAHAGEPLLDDEETHRLERRLHHRRSQDATERQRVGRLSPREVAILQALADGLPPKEAGRRLGITQTTFRTHVQNILMKLGVHSRTEAIVLAIRHGVVSAAE